MQTFPSFCSTSKSINTAPRAYPCARVCGQFALLFLAQKARKLAVSRGCARVFESVILQTNTNFLRFPDVRSPKKYQASNFKRQLHHYLIMSYFYKTLTTFHSFTDCHLCYRQSSISIFPIASNAFSLIFSE